MYLAFHGFFKKMCDPGVKQCGLLARMNSLLQHNIPTFLSSATRERKIVTGNRHRNMSCMFGTYVESDYQKWITCTKTVIYNR